MPLPLLLRSKYDKISKEEIAKSIEDDQRDYSNLDEFEKQERTLDQLGSDSRDQIRTFNLLLLKDTWLSFSLAWLNTAYYIKSA